MSNPVGRDALPIGNALGVHPDIYQHTKYIYNLHVLMIPVSKFKYEVLKINLTLFFYA